MALAHHVVFKSPVAMETLFSIPLITGGAFLFTGNPFSERPTTNGIILAFTSNIFLALRNVAIKKMPDSATAIAPRSKRILQAWIVSIIISFAALGALRSQKALSTTTLLTCIVGTASGLFHVVYSYISTNVILKVMGVVSHSLANIAKRLLVVLLLYLFGRQQASHLNFVGLALCGVGLWLCFHGKLAAARKDHASSPLILKKALLCTVLVVTISSLALYIKRLHLGKELLIPKNVNTDDLEHEPFNMSRLFQMQIHHNTTVLTTDRPKSSIVENSANKEVTAHVTVTPNEKLKRRTTRLDRSSNIENDPSDRNNTQLYNSTTENMPPAVYWRNQSCTESQRFMTNSTEFHFRRLTEHPNETNLLASRLSTNVELVAEAQRILLNILKDLIGTADHVMLMDTATHENKGDPAITMGEVMLLKKLNKTIVFYCQTYSCTDKHLDSAMRISSEYTLTELVILMQGGGNIAYYPFNDRIREKVMAKFSGFRMIILSQSIWFGPRDKGRILLCQRLYSHNPNLTLLTRDQQSYDIARKYFKGLQIVLAPDMAFGIGTVPRSLPPTFDILWLRRQDKESPLYSLPEFPPGVIVHVTDWLEWTSNRGVSDMETSFIIAHNGLTFLQRGRVVVTDRLHGHILSTLLNIPHVLLDNPPAKKLSSFYNTWTICLENTVLVTDAEEALSVAMKLLSFPQSSSISKFVKQSRSTKKSITV